MDTFMKQPANDALALEVAVQPHLRTPRDASDPQLLPAEQPLEMPEQDFSRRNVGVPVADRSGSWIARVTLLCGTLLLTGIFGYELHEALTLERMTPLQAVFLILATISFGWIALGSLSAALGFLPLFAEEKADTINVDTVRAQLKTRTALLFPVYHEEPSRIAGTVAAMAGDLFSAGKAQSFDVFILSDTRGAEAGAVEEACYAELRRGLSSVMPIYYRRRVANTGRKAGNIKDWIERFGAGYDHFVILDGDSIMSADALLRLATAMEENPRAGLIQTVPRLTGGTTLLQRLQQFASNIYGPSVAAGLAFWHRSEGNYWGHNAMIRTRAFAEACGLPKLPGEAPFGGHIQSHDFVEAMLLQRAGWGAHMTPSIRDTFEGTPPTLSDVRVRDRRWAQGNLQHLSIVGQSGIPGMGRIHLAMGAFSYLVSLIWALSLGVGIVLALQSQHIIPSYFLDRQTLFPIWPVMDPGAAMRLFLSTMSIVLLPKALGLVLEIKRAARAGELFGMPRALAGVAIETVFSMLIAPVQMMTQTSAIIDILRRVDSGWAAQSRFGTAFSLREAMRGHWRHTAMGIGLVAICWMVSPGLLFWMSPVIAGLLLSGPVHWLTARPAGPALEVLLSTPEDRERAPILLHAERETSVWARRLALFGGAGSPSGDLRRAA
jgi:membrane glycosyltransferase